jgi:hypothetical protein
LFEELAADQGKNEQTMLRTRRENVTEMILEPISDFNRAPFLSDTAGVGAEALSLKEVLAHALDLEEKAEGFYIRAAEKIKALPEVSRALARMASKRSAHRRSLSGLAEKAGLTLGLPGSHLTDS